MVFGYKGINECYHLGHRIYEYCIHNNNQQQKQHFIHTTNGTCLFRIAKDVFVMANLKP